VRLDSGDLVALARRVRRILDDGGCTGITIFASGGLDEDEIAAMLRAGAPIDGFGVGTSVNASSDAPTLDCAYKLQEYAGLPRRKYSPGKETWPGRKQVWRRHGADGRMTEDIIGLEDDAQPGEPLLAPMMREGRRVRPAPSLDHVRDHAARELARLPDALRSLGPGEAYPVRIADALKRLAAETDRRVMRQP